MSSMVAYLCHPVAGDVVANLTSARMWLRWLIDRYPHVAFCAPWIPYVETLDDSNPEHRSRGLSDGLAMLARSDEVWLVGDRVSSGMEMERDHGLALGLPVINFTTSCIGPSGD